MAANESIVDPLVSSLISYRRLRIAERKFGRKVVLRSERGASLGWALQRCALENFSGSKTQRQQRVDGDNIVISPPPPPPPWPSMQRLSLILHHQLLQAETDEGTRELLCLVDTK
ncbi:hypothetical protein NQZ68_013712 [Dissostichus eleginoides]|nr:hypothetical protein NQZ68_013712 [Dissostichus eleginoides]